MYPSGWDSAIRRRYFDGPVRAAEWRHKEVERAAYRLLQELDAATP
jgi:hypothetical protein